MRFRFLLLSLMALLPATANGQEATSKGVTVANAWARATPGGATVGAAFLEIRTDKNTSDRLTGVSSPVADKAEVHSSSMQNGVMKMRRLDAIDLKPGETLVLKPMGDHIMLFNLKQPLKEGDAVPPCRSGPRPADEPRRVRYLSPGLPAFPRLRGRRSRGLCLCQRVDRGRRRAPRRRARSPASLGVRRLLRRLPAEERRLQPGLPHPVRLRSRD